MSRSRCVVVALWCRCRCLFGCFVVAVVVVIVVVVRCLMFALPSLTLFCLLQICASVPSKNDSHFSGRFLNLSPYCQNIRLFLVNKRMT